MECTFFSEACDGDVTACRRCGTPVCGNCRARGPELCFDCVSERDKPTPPKRVLFKHTFDESQLQFTKEPGT